ncbi:MAG: aminodeoxychorismate synthase component I [Moraxella sp.]|nr:aminodeoxychorismate synthase component I [Moraxella sp.]
MPAPFFFLIDFEQQNPLILPLDKAAEHGVFFDILGISNISDMPPTPQALDTDCTDLVFDTSPMPMTAYEQGFGYVQEQLQQGNSYLVNLTYPTPIKTNLGLQDIFVRTAAPYRLYYKDKFVCFSPETFVKIADNTISTYPMKGTINAHLPHAHNTLLNSQKETQEHYTIVDLMRNDLAMVATDVQVAQFRYIDTIDTHHGQILQTSSHITGTLPSDWRDDPLSVITPMLPAGSVSGAPKAKTLKIIEQAEGQPRGYYTGVFGIFDGSALYSAVAIRYIEQTATGLQFRSGGGITSHSDCNDEYQELLDKVYVPIV